jgi:hypothetical protein
VVIATDIKATTITVMRSKTWFRLFTYVTFVLLKIMVPMKQVILNENGCQVYIYIVLFISHNAIIMIII